MTLIHSVQLQDVTISMSGERIKPLVDLLYPLPLMQIHCTTISQAYLPSGLSLQLFQSLQSAYSSTFCLYHTSPSSSMDKPAEEPNQATILAVESILEQFGALRDVPLDQIRERIRTLGVYNHLSLH
jgi:hypothetical protein